MGKAIGIDLGTTNSCVAVVEGGRPVVIANSEGERTTPSVVAFAKDGQRLVGSPAVRQSAVNPDRTFASVKRHMGSSWRASVDGRQRTPQEISAMVLRKLRGEAEGFLGGQVEGAVITVPAYFNDAQRQATKDAGRIAGLNVLRIVNEPTAAAMAYGLDHGSQQKVMVYDFGGGTFDVSIIEIGQDVIEVLATAGDNQLGGDDITERVAQRLAEGFKADTGLDVRLNAESWQRVKEAAEQAKKDLSTQASTEMSVLYLAQKDGLPLHLRRTVLRSEFENDIRDIVERTTAPVEQALYDAGIAASELDQVILVGGSTRIPLVRDHVRKLTGTEPSSSINPDECVAQGAAILADTLANAGGAIVPGGKKDAILLLDVVPISFAIETVGGVATRVIERNTTLPVHYTQVFTTAASFQTKVEVRVLQGERPMAADNKVIGKFVLKGIKRAPAGVPKIEVSFDIDVDGILTVTARDQDTGKEQSITITESERLSEEEIQQAIRDAEQYAAADAERVRHMEELAEAQSVLAQADEAVASAGKDADKSHKKELKREANALRRQLMKRPEKMSDRDRDDIAATVKRVREAIGRLS